MALPPFFGKKIKSDILEHQLQDRLIKLYLLLKFRFMDHAPVTAVTDGNDADV